jgi:hypothetical protein
MRNSLLSFHPVGAELQSIKDVSGHEYLWQADPKYWGRHSPILFPIVCGLWNGKYRAPTVKNMPWGDTVSPVIQNLNLIYKTQKQSDIRV